MNTLGTHNKVDMKKQVKDAKGQYLSIILCILLAIRSRWHWHSIIRKKILEFVALQETSQETRIEETVKGEIHFNTHSVKITI